MSAGNIWNPEQGETTRSMNRWQNGAAEAEDFRQAAPFFCTQKKKLKKCEKTVDKSAFVC